MLIIFNLIRPKRNEFNMVNNCKKFQIMRDYTDIIMLWYASEEKIVNHHIKFDNIFYVFL